MYMDFRIIKYTEDKEKEWDDFIINRALNGTFLQSRRFLNYHPKNRFVDASYMIYDSKNHLIAICPACEKNEANVKILFSHSGSTYGGIIICAQINKAVYLLEMLRQLEIEWRNDGFVKVVLKQTPSLFSHEEMSLLQYIFFYSGYNETKDLNLYIDLSNSY